MSVVTWSTRLDVAKRIKEVAYLEGDFTTRAGKKTTYYIDKYLFETQPDILAAVADELVKLLPEYASFDLLGAPELGAVPIAAAVSMRCGKPYIIIRKQNKNYGTDRLIEGRYSPQNRVVMIEDILTTGGAVLQACETAEEAGLVIHQIIGVINREEGATQAINAKGYSSTELLTRTDLQSV